MVGEARLTVGVQDARLVNHGTVVAPAEALWDGAVRHLARRRRRHEELRVARVELRVSRQDLADPH
eukprot:1262618-Alexandrium_andersonii.AAC.1